MTTRPARLALAAALAALPCATPLKAENGASQDRADFDAAAGRALLFEPTSLVENDPLRPRAAEPRVATARSAQPERRAVRVILPSPYAR